MKKLLTLFILLASPLLCGHYSRTLDSISYRSQNGSTIALIQLSDESVWKWTPDSFSENLIRNWSKGDEVVIKTNCKPGYILHNLQKPLYCPTVTLTFNSYTLYPFIEEIDHQAETLTLSDGSEWELEYDFNKRSLVHWTVGDRIIPVQGMAEYRMLINLDIPPENRCQVERSIQIAPYQAVPPSLSESSKTLETDEDI